MSKLSHKERGRRGGLSTARKYGREHMQAIGRKGFASTCSKYFDGDRQALYTWLSAKGLAAQDPYPANGAFQDPGAFPAGGAS
jgi:general stress protein YciG